MRNPDIYTATQIKNWNVAGETELGLWIPCRPLPSYRFFRFFHNLKICWYVFIGKYDVLSWGNNKKEI